ncbi:TM helix [Sphingomonas sp. HMP9]|uniref:mechanosensitive ion channel family protein n=1 Tax=Sphingomonas sp. HMP9 TaxID=1517554 RepID=UPI001596D085|nr:hypothetical protein [Sphingomonas sp. HMP9]BCA61396.1 TM helix [Sphingomonas sp. HMP9]
MAPLAIHASEPNANPRNPTMIGAQAGDAAYWVVLLIALFLATQPLGLNGATEPLGDMLQGFGQAVPRIIGAALILFLGYVPRSVGEARALLMDRTAPPTPADLILLAT